MWSFAPQQNECKLHLVASLYADAFVPTDFQIFVTKPGEQDADCWDLQLVAWMAGLWPGTLLPSLSVEQPSFNAMPAVNSSQIAEHEAMLLKVTLTLTRGGSSLVQGRPPPLELSCGSSKSFQVTSFLPWAGSKARASSQPSTAAVGGSLLHLHHSPLWQRKSPPAKGW